MNKNKAKRGFTLVELIVVLVILAVLAALLVPALTGYIDKARKSQVIAETRMLHTAIQTEISELYAKPEWQGFAPSSNWKKSIIASGTSDSDLSDDVAQRYNNIAKLSELSALQNGTGSYSGYVSVDGNLVFLMYYDGKGHIGLYFDETKETMALDVPREAPNYTSYLFNQLRCVEVPEKEPDGSYGGNYVAKNVILQSIGYRDKVYD